MKNNFAGRIKELRAEAGLTQKQLAEKIDVLERTVSYWEQGKRECDFDMLLKLAAYFSVSVDYLLGQDTY